jgi:hypothetical protein
VKDPRAEGARPGTVHSRRRNGFIGSMVIGAVALTVIVVPHFISSSPVSNGDTDPANGTQQTDVAHPSSLEVSSDPCPPEPARVTDDALGVTMLGEENAIPLRDDAALIRICPASYPGVGTTFWAPPLDALTVGLPDFFAEMRAADGWKPMACTANVPPVNPLALVVDDRAGGRQTFALKDPYCRGVAFEGHIYNLGVFLAAYTDALDGQRAELAAPVADANGLSCARRDERPSFIDPGRHLELAAALICQVPDASLPIESQQAVSKIAPSWLLDSINADFADGVTVHAVPPQQCTDDPTGPATYIVGVNAWGDPRFLSDQDQCAFRFVRGLFPPNGSQRVFWVPAVVDAVAMRRGLH